MYYECTVLYLSIFSAFKYIFNTLFLPEAPGGFSRTFTVTVPQRWTDLPRFTMNKTTQDRRTRDSKTGEHASVCFLRCKH